MDIKIEIHRISVANILINLIIPIITVTLLIIIYLLIMITANGNSGLTPFSYIVLFLVLFTMVPSIVLTINYYLVDKGKRIIIDNEERDITLISQNKKQHISFQEIDYIERISRKSEDEFFSTMPWHPLYYYVIHLKSKESIKVTTLTIRKLDKKIPSTRMINTWSAFPFIKEINV